MSLSDDVAVWTCSQLTVCVELSKEMSDSSTWLCVGRVSSVQAPTIR